MIFASCIQMAICNYVTMGPTPLGGSWAPGQACRPMGLSRSRTGSVTKRKTTKTCTFKMDVLLLIDVFENFRKKCIQRLQIRQPVPFA